MGLKDEVERAVSKVVEEDLHLWVFDDPRIVRTLLL